MKTAQEQARFPRGYGSSSGGYKVAEYNVWRKMISRCSNPKDKDFPYYGGRGIGVSDMWYECFHNFITDMGNRPKGTMLERKDNDLGYSKENCIWATRKQQMNNKRSNRLLHFSGLTLTMAQWSERLGFRKGTILFRLKRGWTIERTLTTPKL